MACLGEPMVLMSGRCQSFSSSGTVWQRLTRQMQPSSLQAASRWSQSNISKQSRIASQAYRPLCMCVLQTSWPALQHCQTEACLRPS